MLCALDHVNVQNTSNSDTIENVQETLCVFVLKMYMKCEISDATEHV